MPFVFHPSDDFRQYTLLQFQLVSDEIIINEKTDPLQAEGRSPSCE
jgi:hypothetical protein